MRRVVIAVLACAPVLSIGAAPSPAGRWEGTAQIPGRALSLVVDLAQDRAGAWTGSIIVPGLGIKGAPLTSIVVTGADASFDTVDALASPPYGPARFSAHLTADDSMTGEMRQGGNEARISLRKAGPAQVELPPRSTPVPRELESQWSGEFELGGYPRQVTLTLENHADAGATARFQIVGKRVNDLPVSLVIQEGDVLRVESRATQIAFEGRIAKEGGEIIGTLEMGPLELPLVLRRNARSAS